MGTITLQLKKTPAELARLCQYCGRVKDEFPDEDPLECPLRNFHCPLTWGCGEVTENDWKEVLDED